LQDPPKFTRIGIFGLKTNHLATLVVVSYDVLQQIVIVFMYLMCPGVGILMAFFQKATYEWRVLLMKGLMDYTQKHLKKIKILLFHYMQSFCHNIFFLVLYESKQAVDVRSFENRARVATDKTIATFLLC
jgi:hypothetical protein